MHMHVQNVHPMPLHIEFIAHLAEALMYCMEHLAFTVCLAHEYDRALIHSWWLTSPNARHSHYYSCSVSHSCYSWLVYHIAHCSALMDATTSLIPTTAHLPHLNAVSFVT